MQLIPIGSLNERGHIMTEISHCRTGSGNIIWKYQSTSIRRSSKDHKKVFGRHSHRDLNTNASLETSGFCIAHYWNSLATRCPDHLILCLSILTRIVHTVRERTLSPDITSLDFQNMGIANRNLVYELGANAQLCLAGREQKHRTPVFGPYVVSLINQPPSATGESHIQVERVFG